MYNYTIDIVGLGCEIVACEITRDEMKLLKKYMKENNLPLEEIFLNREHLSKTGLGVSEWYELDDICHVYGSYPNMSSVKVIGEETKVYRPMELRTFVDDFYSLTEFDSVHSIMEEKGTLVSGKLTINEPFNPDLLSLLVTKLQKEDKNLYIITGYTYADEYLKLESTNTEEIKLTTFINKTKDDLCII